MKRILFLTIFTFFSFIVYSQCTGIKPNWVKQTPAAPQQNHFYYRVTYGEDPNIEKAEKKAKDQAIKEHADKLGIRVDVISGDSVLTDAYTMKVNINKVCMYCEQDYCPTRYRVYVLWQIANDALHKPKWEEFNRCDDTER